MLSPSHVKPIPCFQCHQETAKPFSKIVFCHNVHFLCNSNCLDIALRALNIIENNLFAMPVAINVGTPYPYNMTPNSIGRSPKMTNLNHFGNIEINSSDDENPFETSLVDIVSQNILSTSQKGSE